MVPWLSSIFSCFLLFFVVFFLFFMMFRYIVLPYNIAGDKDSVEYSFFHLPDKETIFIREQKRD